LFDAEYLWNYETGIKGQWLNDKLALNASIFYMDRKDQQIQNSTQLDPNNPATFIFFTDNVGSGNNRGVELEMNYLATNSLELYANLGLLKTRIDNRNDPERDGRAQAHAPEYSYALGGRYDFNQHWFTRLDISGKDNFYFSDSHNQLSNHYNLVNARFGYTTDNWALTLWGRNLFDQEYAVRGFFFGNEPARDFADTLYTRLGDPRHFGLSFTYDYSSQ